jgi:hypothetical protein
VKRFGYKTKFFRIAVFLLVTFIILGGVTIAISYKYPQVPIKVYIWWNFSKRKAPELYVVPNGIIMVDEKSIDNSDLKKIYFKKIDLFLPHSNIAKIHRMKSNDTVIIALKNEMSISIDPTLPSFQDMLREDPEIDRHRMEEIYGTEMFSTIFDFHRAIANTTPDSVSIFSSPAQAVKVQVFLLLKMFLNPSARNGSSFLKIGEINGIQFGDPQKDEKPVLVYLYPPDGTHCRLTFYRFEQNDIINVLSLIRYREIN